MRALAAFGLWAVGIAVWVGLMILVDTIFHPGSWFYAFDFLASMAFGSGLTIAVLEWSER